ncbi:hypothetical protein DACRYDRAFT_22041 [Dacryopinax primogenitus]|uniref:Uncharacterized protein n=1 Tax=Dacryopinax primogenitus (strain DJM 731) TaxID=1858805 RepID=M5GDG7_DACPD|nr:uncharacterized protein DACRYDRAFT_22041 [Dacryopinax primogenitus]EJU02378.1 hypothetical protein DACRYDRAFT_22041 [Dacryopinax primogenitus]
MASQTAVPLRPSAENSIHAKYVRAPPPAQTLRKILPHALSLFPYLSHPASRIPPWLPASPPG